MRNIKIFITDNIFTASRIPKPYWLSLMLGMFLLSGCASTPVEDKTAGWSTQKIYEEAQAESKSGGYDKAIPLYTALEGRAIGTPLGQQAMLEKAYAQHKNQEPAKAIATINQFIRLYPGSAAMDYALYLKGTINFSDNLGLFGSVSSQDLSERDPQASKDAYEAFRELVQKYPNSRYTPDAKQRLTYILNSLAQYEVHVARYYYSKGAYIAAINRAQTAVADYRDVPALEEAMYIIYRSYEALGMDKLRDDAKRILETSYPKSAYLGKLAPNTGKAWWRFW